MRSLLLCAVVLMASAASANEGGHLHHPGADHRHSIYGDGLSEEKAVCNVCTDIIVPALDEAIFASTPGENWKEFVEDIVHGLPAKYRYDIENHVVVDHDDTKHGTDPCVIVQEQVHAITFDPHCHASVAALAQMYHTDSRVKSHLKRLAIHAICPCIDDITKEDGEFDSLLESHVHVTDRLQHEYDLHHEEYEHTAPIQHEHLSEPKVAVKELSRAELEEMEWQEDRERHEAKEHGDHNEHDKYGHGMGDTQHSGGNTVRGDQGSDPHDQLTGQMKAPEQEGEDRGDHELNLAGLGIGHNEL